MQIFGTPELVRSIWDRLTGLIDHPADRTRLIYEQKDASCEPTSVLLRCVLAQLATEKDRLRRKGNRKDRQRESDGRKGCWGLQRVGGGGEGWGQSNCGRA